MIERVKEGNDYSRVLTLHSRNYKLVSVYQFKRWITGCFTWSNPEFVVNSANHLDMHDARLHIEAITQAIAVFEEWDKDTGT